MHKPAPLATVDPAPVRGVSPILATYETWARLHIEARSLRVIDCPAPNTVQLDIVRTGVEVDATGTSTEAHADRRPGLAAAQLAMMTAADPTPKASPGTTWTATAS